MTVSPHDWALAVGLGCPLSLSVPTRTRTARTSCVQARFDALSTTERARSQGRIKIESVLLRTHNETLPAWRLRVGITLSETLQLAPVWFGSHLLGRDKVGWAASSLAVEGRLSLPHHRPRRRRRGRLCRRTIARPADLVIERGARRLRSTGQLGTFWYLRSSQGTRGKAMGEGVCNG